MAQILTNDNAAPYEVADRWKNECLVNSKSLLWPDAPVWSLSTLEGFKAGFIDRPDESSDSFENKLKRQLDDQAPLVTQLACEILLIYFLFTSSVTSARKRSLIQTVAAWKSLNVPDDAPAMAGLDHGLGNTGLAFNTGRPFEIMLIAQFALHVAGLADAEKKALLSNHLLVRKALDDLADGKRLQSRHILLHLLFPQSYEAIASSQHKRLIAKSFKEVVEGELPEDLDDQLLAIRQRLQVLLPGLDLSFYRTPLRECWYVTDKADELSPLQAIGIKRQIVFYGPPGTGKTFEAKALADTAIRQGVLRAWGPKRYFTDSDGVNALIQGRIRRVQFHPGYGYEDLIRGLHLTDGGKTEYSDGVLLGIIESINRQPADVQSIPFVVILDEMNRADLSKVLGECFSLLEDREGAIQLAGHGGQPRFVSMPPTLMFIGTMNLIDQSLEQVDFALRRRFLWFFRGFSREDFLSVAAYRWNAQQLKNLIGKPWDRFAEEFALLADRAVRLNEMVENHPSLGPQYQIGHTYFCDVVSFAQETMAESPGVQTLLFRKNGQGRAPVRSLWLYSLKPLLEQYLSGSEGADRANFLGRSESVLMSGSEV